VLGRVTDGFDGGLDTQAKLWLAVNGVSLPRPLYYARLGVRQKVEFLTGPLRRMRNHPSRRDEKRGQNRGDKIVY